PVRRGRHQARAVRAERDAEDLADMPPARGQQRAGGRVPHARRPVFAGPGEARAVRAEGGSPDAIAVALPFGHRLAGSRIEHRKLPRLTLKLWNHQPRAVWAHDDGADLFCPRYFHATEDLAGLVQQVESRVRDPHRDAKSAASLRGGELPPASGPDRPRL